MPQSQTEQKMIEYLSKNEKLYKVNGRMFILNNGKKRVLPKRYYGNSICIYDSDKEIVDNYNPDIYVFSDGEEDPIMKKKYKELLADGKIKRIGKYESRHIKITVEQYNTISKYAKMYGLTIDALIEEICGKMNEEIKKEEKKRPYH